MEKFCNRLRQRCTAGDEETQTSTGGSLKLFEDECVGNSPGAIQGIVVTRIEADKVFVSDWNISSHFVGDNVLEQFEEAKNSQNFEFSFRNERALREEDCLDGVDPVLKQQLRKQCLPGQSLESNLGKLKQAISRKYKH